MGRYALPDGYLGSCIESIGSIWFIILGNVIEWFELSSFGFLAPQLDENLFHGNSAAMWAAFAVSFIARPLGATCFGWISDKVGRRLSVVLSLAGLVVGTVGQGMLPTYTCCGDGGGHTGVVLLIILRIVLGFCVGGEIAGVSVYLAEYKDQSVLGTMSASISVGASLGFALSTALISALLHTLTEEEMMLWGWRIPFLITIVPGAISLVLRWTHIKETHEVLRAGFISGHNSDVDLDEDGSLNDDLSHCSGDGSAGSVNSDDRLIEQEMTKKEVKKLMGSDVLASLQYLPEDIERDRKHRIHEDDSLYGHLFPLFALLRHYPVRFMLGFFGVAACAMGWYIGSIYVVSYVQKFQKVSNQDAMLMGLINSSMSVVFTPIGGFLADAIGVGKTHVLSTLLLFLICIPFWAVLVLVEDNRTVYFIAFAVYGAIQGICCAVPFLYVAELFPKSLRASGFLSYNLGIAIFGGLSPLLCEVLALRITYGPMVYQAGISLVALGFVGAAHYAHAAGAWKLPNIRMNPF
ncbi:hypothetical protein SARC_01010 [Sphaeroforma arctica JP610]|uniref:Major facilitator superfamily (MFS) profile domain-containing protein n=1 Tax=Sphaeroforma arctica JP610 TaxID=667725 RepID=A0A0L0GD78_9EUKA|nr:hypothetical protein SARC_01010 [Sphaeroforma arctica JP610]KNC86864.1 hypothetical protein SARC_01010 [Sphaeroforma arctica JP610]|eukprot:XP_014160766.1 hypothetical protein SARC_01010 [Sphaeroforma arctica JP610]